MKNEAKNTLTQDQAPITMTEWKALPKDKQTGNYWVVDKDGWAYWANILAPGETTSLLLDQLNWNSESVGGLDKWYYGIDVVGEFVSPIDKDKFPNSEHGAPSTDANYLIANLTEIDLDQVTLDFTSDVSSVSMKSDATEQFGAQVNQMTLSGPSDLKADDIEWTISPSTAGTVDKTGKVTLNSLDADTDITVTAKSASYNLSNSFTIKGLKAEDKYALDFTSDVSNVSIKSGESQQFGAKVNKVTTSGSSDVSATDITWSISPESAGTVDETGKVTLNSLDADTDITVTAKSDTYNVSKSFTLKGLKAESEDEGE